METLDEFKKNWAGNTESPSNYDVETMNRIVKQRVKKHTNVAMKYFWASFFFQILVYALLTHVAVKYWYDPSTVGLALVGVALFIPFTKTLMSKFKAMAFIAIKGPEISSVQRYVLNQRETLADFFRFKKRYELVLIPLSTLVGVLLTFKLYVPGGPIAYPNGVITTTGITWLSCYLAIRAENRKHFQKPLQELENLLNEYNADIEPK